MFRIFAKKREQIAEAEAGEIVAAVGLKNVLTGDTLCDPRSPVVLPHIEFAETVISLSIEPASGADRENLAAALKALARQDPTFEMRRDPETGEDLISGMGELHLEVLVNRLRREMNVPVRVGKPRVSFRETVAGVGEAEGQFIRQTGGRGHYAVVKLRVEPFEPAEGEEHFRFVNETGAGMIRREFARAVEQGCREAAQSGVLMGYPAINIQATLLEGREHETDSSELAFESAARLGFDAAMREASPVLMEPIMKLELSVPEAFFGVVNGDLNGRRAIITHTEARSQGRVIHAEVPLMTMFGYSKEIRSLTQGRAGWTMEPLRYQAVPPAVADEILEKAY
jgi:elongation factor G